MKRILKRVWYARKRIKLLLIILICVYVSVFIEIYASGWVYPRTHLGNTNISMMSKSEINTLVSTFTSLEYHVNVQNRQYSYTYPDLGVKLSTDNVNDIVFAPNRRPFPFNAFALIHALFTPTYLDVPLSFTQDFGRFITETIFDFGIEADAVYFNERDKSLIYVENEERYQIDEAYFVTLLRERVGNNTAPLYPKLTKIINTKAQEAADTDSKIKQIFLTPLTVFVETESNKESFMLTEKDLSEIATVALSDDQTNVIVGVNENALVRIINSHVKNLNVLAYGNVVTPKVKEDIRDILTARFNTHTIDALTIGLDNGPNTTGIVADRYIEVDISQQKMYLFKDGKLFKDYRVSTGLDYPTPTGQFTILNKTSLGFSQIYDVWLPWWMGFKYSDELHAYFGIHELPYKEIEGKKISRPSNFIGQPNTGGCVALDVGAAREVYQFADIGTKVHIYQ